MQDLETIFQRLAGWIDKLSTASGAGMHEGGKPSLLPTSFLVLASELSCDKSQQAQFQGYAEILQDSQDAASGLFDPGDLRRKELTSHSATYLRLQATYFAIHALDVLQERPKHRIKFAQQLQNIDYLHGWLDGGPWHNPWLHSNNVMFALTFLQTDSLWYGEEASLVAFDSILDYLDEKQDPESGLWQPDDGNDMQNAVYAAYHFFPYYFWRKRKPQYVEQIIDSTLSIQEANGLYGGGACEDLDAVHTLVLMSLISQHRDAEVRLSLERCFWRLLQIQKSDGGFCNSATTPMPWVSWKRKLLESLGVWQFLPKKFQSKGMSAPPVWAYSGWKQLQCPANESDVWGSWFRPLAIKLIADRYQDLAGTCVTGSYRKLPGLGWHDEEIIRATSDSEVETTGILST